MQTEMSFDAIPPNHPASGNAGIVLLFQNESLWPGVPEPGVSRYIKRV
jgi:hypothetical protein